MKADERCRCGERATAVVTRRNDRGRVSSVTRACQRHADEAVSHGATPSYTITPPVDIADRGWKS